MLKAVACNNHEGNPILNGAHPEKDLSITAAVYFLDLHSRNSLRDGNSTGILSFLEFQLH